MGEILEFSKSHCKIASKGLEILDFSAVGFGNLKVFVRTDTPYTFILTHTVQKRRG